MDINSSFFNCLGIEFRNITGGCFDMGAPLIENTSRENERPIHKETISSFAISVYPITQIQYKQLLHTNPSFFSTTGCGAQLVSSLETDHFPVESVSWEEAKIFCDILSNQPEEINSKRVYRLPTEAEWEYACRAGCMMPFNIGNSFTSLNANICGLYPYNSSYIGPSLNRPCIVGAYPPNAWGLYDMHGNVWEWCMDEYTFYGNDKKYLNARVLRGGSWNSYSRFCRSAYRCVSEKDVHYYDCGFRIVCTISN